MYLVPNLDNVKIAIIKLKKDDYELFGFLLYTDMDEEMVNYMRRGIYELDNLSGEKCAIFAFESPTFEWIQYTKRNNHVWWKLNKRMLNEYIEKINKEKTERQVDKDRLFTQITLSNIENSNIIIGDYNDIGSNNSKISLKQLIEPNQSLPFGYSEAINVARHFNLRLSQLPSLIFFEDPESKFIWNLSLRGKNKQDLTYFFREVFDSEQFQSLLNRKWGNLNV
ncbi:hypothetical protein FZD47_10630 [Bacillus infantis]|uniref:Uncharacterized protein n=1 Tax=Bacillus infantis TaxID=324767 RepID=A0A5D4SL52_9BACI|nr:hypothetical protein [Bacillus infantis]TYS63950.1 hypothetical protein FZD47_10630 [Bacillus infantis]